jgi:RNA polymerase sigma-70 factor, ECF subfamily
MDSTSINLLTRLSEPNANVAWQRFIDLYTPMIYHWARQRGLPSEDAADLVQDILITLIVKMRNFEYDPSLRFRGWLRTITINRVIDHQRRSKGRTAETLDSASLQAKVVDGDFFSEREYQRRLVQRTLQLLQNEYPDLIWQAAWCQLINAESATAVAQRLNITKNQAYLAKSRILARLREELGGLLE